MAGKADGSVIIDTRMNTSGFRAGMANMKKGFSGISGSLGKLAKVMAGVFAVKQLVQFGKEAIELGSDLSEVQNVVDVTFGNLNEEINDFAKNAITQFGLSETAAKQYTSTMGAMLKSMGFTTREAADMSKTMTGLAADMASFYNLDAEEAFAKIRSGISGETEPLKQLGINLNVANLEQYALTQGITKSYNAMTQQEQALLRYNYLLSVTADAQGDFARTSDSWANQTRILAEQFKALKATIGQGLINVFLPVIKVINTLLAKLATVANAFKSFTELITGKKSSGATGASEAGITETNIPEITESYDSAAESAGNYASATEDAADATEEAEKENKTYLSGLDEIRRYAEDTEEDEDESIPSLSGGIPGGVSGIQDAVDNIDYGNLAEGETVFDQIIGIIDKLMEKFRELKNLFASGFWDGLGDYKPAISDILVDFESIKNTVKDVCTDPGVLDAINNFAKRLAYAFGQITGAIASIALTIADLFVGALEKYLKQNKDRIKRYITSMFDVAADIVSIAGELAKAFADIFSVFRGETAQQIAANIIGIFAEVGMLISETALKLGRDILNMIALPIIQNKDKIKAALQGTLEAIEPITAGFLKGVQAISDGITRLYDEHLKPFFDSVAQGLSDILGALLDGYNTYIVPILQALGQKFEELMDGPFREMVDKAVTALGKLIDAIKLLWENVLVPFIVWLTNTIIPIVAPIIEFIGNAVLDAFGKIMEVIGYLFDAFGGLIDFLVGVFTQNWDMAFRGLQEISEGLRNAILSIFDAIENILILFDDYLQNIFSQDWSQSFGFLGEILNGFLDFVEVIWNMVKGVFEGILQFFRGVFTGDWSQAWSGIEHIFDSIWTGIKNIAKIGVDFVQNVIQSAWNIIESISSSIWGGISSLLSGIWDGISSTASRIFGGIVSVIQDAFSTVSGIIGGLKGAFGDAISAASDAVSNIVSFFANIQLPHIPMPHFSVGSEDVSIAGISFSVPSVSVDWYAKGGLFDQPSLIGVGEAGKEAVLPLENRKTMSAIANSIVANLPKPYLASGAVVPPKAQYSTVNIETNRRQEMDDMYSMMKDVLSRLGQTVGNNTSGGTYEFIAQLNRRTIFDEIVAEAKLRQSKTGRNPFELA